MTTKLNNHTVTRGYLAGWKSTNDNGSDGIWYFDIESREICFSTSLKASFAIRKGIYSPTYAETPDDRLENWFAESESELCQFAREYTRAGKTKFKPKVIKKALAAMISHGYRSEYSIDGVVNALSIEYPDKTIEEIKIIGLNNLYSGLQDRIDFFTRGVVLLLEGSDPVVMTNDQPFWDMTPQAEQSPMAIFPLSPHRMMVFLPSQKPPAGDMVIAFVDAAQHPQMLEFAKLAAMRMARSWVVCPNREAAEKVKDYLTEERMAEVRSTDKMRHLALSERKLFPL